MFFTIIIYHLIFFVNFSSQNIFNWPRFLNRETEEPMEPDGSTNSPLNGTNQPENFIKKSELAELYNLKQQYILKNHIDEFETHYGLHFVPNWNNVNQYLSPARQNIQIRRQKWMYIFDKFNESYAVDRLSTELQRAGINRMYFSKDIADIYFILSDNAYIFDKEPNSDKKHKYFEYVRNPLHEKSVRAFLNAVSDSKLVWSKNEEIVQLPKSLYIDLMRKDAHAALIRQHHKEQMLRLKAAYKRRVQQARTADSDAFVNSEVSSY